MTEGSKFTDRQLAVLRGEEKPVDQNEWDLLQNEANTILPPKQDEIKKAKPLFTISGDDIERSRQRDHAGSPASHSVKDD